GNVVGPALSVRAMYISNGHTAVELVGLDSQAEFAAYQEGARYGSTYARDVAAAEIDGAHLGPRMTSGDIILQATHGHATPTLEGLWGPVAVPYLEQVTQGEIRAMVQAARAAGPARLQIGTADAAALDDTKLAQYDAYPGWPGDSLLSVLRAVSPAGATVATYVTVPAHPDIVCGQCLGKLSADYPGLLREHLQRQLGGIAIVGSGTLGREETPVQATGITDMKLFSTQVTNLTDQALARARWITNGRLGAAQRFVEVPATNPALVALNEAYGLPAGQRQKIETATGEYPIDRRDTAPYATGNLAGTWLTALRVGNVAYVSMPGESFPEVREGIARSTNAPLVIALDKGQDDLGYFYPSWVTPFAAAVYPSDGFTNSTGPLVGQAVIRGQLANLAALGYTTTTPPSGPAPGHLTHSTAPGLQVMGGPYVGDAGASGKLTTHLLAVYSPPDLPEGTLAYGPPTGGLPVDEEAKGPVHWSFGDGSRGRSGYHDFSGSDVTPTELVHEFTVGTHTVRAWVMSADGQLASWTFHVVVFPALHAAISQAASPGPRREVTYRATARGGDGRYLAYRWRFSDGTSASGAVVRHVFSGQKPPGVVLTVTDGTGSAVTVS
ncbi:MAG TPA: PKD domain-containing protein, partial [Solirubrobacteraceae bacterium]|nr:PKD domain-containing protein [Solirubrobacteraceae bacterium]